MLAYIQYAMHVIMSFMFITMIFVMLPRAAVSAKRIGEVLDTEISITDSEQPIDMTNKNIEGKLEFKGVGFAYPDAKAKVLSDISFVAQPGKITAIIGGTGSGKSSLISLIPRFYDVTEGQILLDGEDIRDYRQSDLRKCIGLVPQKGRLFSGTIETNLLYGDDDADEAALKEAAEVAQAMDFINDKPNGMDEEVAQGGTNVSGGQKQRLCIARALAKKAQIYIFDDSFSALDFTTDKALRAALGQYAADSTVIIVAQRINTIMNADQIIVLDEGKMVGIGTHRQLLQDCSVYKEIALSQLSEKELQEGGAYNG